MKFIIFTVCLLTFSPALFAQAKDSDKVIEALAKTQQGKTIVKNLEKYVPDPVKDIAPYIGMATERRIVLKWKW